MSEPQKIKILMIRISSFGDIIAMLSVATAIKERFPGAELHWLTRADYQEIAQCGKSIHRVWAIDKKQGVKGLLNLVRQMRSQNFTHIYDGHNNLRSHLVVWGLRGPWGLFSVFKNQKFLRRSQYRWRRFLLFRFRINKYPQPFVHQWALLEPLQKWGVSLSLPPPPLLQIPPEIRQQSENLLQEFRRNGKPIIALSPSASYELKRWPVQHWKEFVQHQSQWNFVALGGPEDQFIASITDVAADRCLNLAGKLSYLQSAGVIAAADAVVSNDTGLMHVAEQLGKKCVALLGPAPFGYPGRKTTLILERHLRCRPCSKHGQGPCVNEIHQKCMVSILPAEVAQTAERALSGATQS